MSASVPSNKKPLIFSILFHLLLLGLLIGFETTQTIYVTPPADDTPIIEASVVFNRAASKPISKPKPEIKPAPKSVPKPEPEPQPEPEPELITKNMVTIKAEVKPPKPDKKREKELKKMAERSLEQAFQQENLEKTLQEDAQENLQKKLQEQDIALKQSAAASQSEINHYMSLIAEKVNKNWRKPLETNTTGLNCLVLIKVLPNGVIADVKVIQGSGDLAFDRSTEIAVRKSSPLPTPKDELVRTAFKSFEFVFKPRGA